MDFLAFWENPLSFAHRTFSFGHFPPSVASRALDNLRKCSEERAFGIPNSSRAVARGTRYLGSPFLGACPATLIAYRMLANKHAPLRSKNRFLERHININRNIPPAAPAPSRPKPALPKKRFKDITNLDVVKSTKTTEIPPGSAGTLTSTTHITKLIVLFALLLV